MRDKMFNYLKNMRIICKAMDRLSAIPESVWRLIVILGFISCLSSIVFNIWWGSHQRADIKKEIRIGLNKENVQLTDNEKVINKYHFVSVKGQKLNQYLRFQLEEYDRASASMKKDDKIIRLQ